MSILSKGDFDAALVEWAKQEFAKEINSDFRRARRFDSLSTGLQISVLLKQTPERLRALSQILPLQVLWGGPDAQRRREALSNGERFLVEGLMSDYDRMHRERGNELVEERWRGQDPEVQEQFMIANHTAKTVITSIALKGKYQVARGAPGEWGLIANRKWGKVTISLHLERLMTLNYGVSINNQRGDCIRNRDNYLVALGFGCGSWKVESADCFSEKLLRACDFAAWHIGEYEAVIERMCGHS